VAVLLLVAACLVPALSGASGSQPAPRVVEWPGLRVDLEERVVEVEGRVGITFGWLEQAACAAYTREHESVVVAEARPSHVPAGLLLLGLEPGRPGRWRRSREIARAYTVTPPEGDPVTASVLWRDPETGAEIEAPLRMWIVDEETGRPLSDQPWRFGGSLVMDWFGEPDVYVADRTGSLLGLVTFGDEVLGWHEVLPDRVRYRRPDYAANTAAMPPTGTPVVLRIRPWIGPLPEPDDDPGPRLDPDVSDDPQPGVRPESFPGIGP